MAFIQKSAQYIGDDAEYQELKAWLVTVDFPPTVYVVYVTNGRHYGHEPRDGQLEAVTYFGICYNVDIPHGGVKLHWYLN